MVKWVLDSGGLNTNTVDQLARTRLGYVLVFAAVCTVERLLIAPLIQQTPSHNRGLAFKIAQAANEGFDALIYAGVFVFLIIRPFCIQAFKIPSPSMVNTLQVGDYIVANKAIYRYSNPKIKDIVVFRPPAWACTQDPSPQVDTDGDVNVDFIKRCIGVPGDVVEVRNGTLYRNGVAQDEPYLKDRMTTDFKLVKYRDQTSDPSWLAWLPQCDEYHKYLADKLPGSDKTYWDVAKETAAKEQLEYWPVTIDSGGGVNCTDNTAVPFHIDRDNMKLQDKIRELPPAKVPPGFYLMMGDNRNESFDGRAWGLVPRDDIVGRSEFIWMPISRWRITR